VEQELGRENPSGGAPNRIVLLTILNAHYPITVDIVHKICKNLGPVDRIVIFQKFFVQASVPDPNPRDPHVFGPPPGSGSIRQRYGSGSRILLSSSKSSKKDLDSYCFVTSFGKMM
jgi:hypothetical protein